MRCDRCGQETTSYTTSMFNLDTICMVCKEDERNAPGYEAASKAEALAVGAGNTNFPGVGLHKRDQDYINAAINFRLRSPFKVGMAVRAKIEIDRFPNFIVGEGATGTVKTLRHDLVQILLDEPPAGSEEWGGCLDYYPDNVPEHAQEYLDELEEVPA